MLSDPIGDMLTRLRNGQTIRKHSVTSPYSKLRESILKVLKEEGYIRSYEVETKEGEHPSLKIELKYYDGRPVIQKIQRYSKPGRRSYSSIKNLPRVANGLGMMILSTSKGVMSDIQARALGLGGEIICSVF